MSDQQSIENQELELMSSIKKKGAELGDLIQRLSELQNRQVSQMGFSPDDPKENAKYNNQVAALTDAMRWTGIGKDQIQTGLMCLVRACFRSTHRFTDF